MTDNATDETVPATQEPPKKDEELSEQQLDGVAGAAGRQVDCEGYTYLTPRLPGAGGPDTTLKSE